MKRPVIKGMTLLVIVAVVVGLSACYGININGSITGSQDLETREYTFSDFNSVEVMSPFQVEISRSDEYRVSVTADDNLFDYIEVTQMGDTLRLRLKPFFSFHSTTFRAEITLPELRALDLSGASSTEVGEFQTIEDVDIDVSAASKLDLVGLQVSNITMDVSGASRVTGYVKAVAADFEVSGASHLELNGSSVDAILEVSGASSLKLQDFSILQASVIVSGASSASIEVNGKLDLEVSGASRLTYGGNPTLGRVEVSGASSLSRR